MPKRAQGDREVPAPAPAQPWANKIVGYGEAVLDQVLANERNWKIHSQFAQDALVGALDDVGIVQNLIINVRRGEAWPAGDRGVETLVDGHRRVIISLRRGQRTWPVTYVDLDPDTERKVLLMLDPLTALSGADREHLAALLQEVQSGNSAVQQMLSDLAIREGVVPAEEPAAPEEFPAYGEDIETDYACPKCGYTWSGNPK